MSSLADLRNALNVFSGLYTSGDGKVKSLEGSFSVIGNKGNFDGLYTGVENFNANHAAGSKKYKSLAAFEQAKINEINKKVLKHDENGEVSKAAKKWNDYKANLATLKTKIDSLKNDTIDEDDVTLPNGAQFVASDASKFKLMSTFSPSGWKPSITGLKLGATGISTSIYGVKFDIAGIRAAETFLKWSPKGKAQNVCAFVCGLLGVWLPVALLCKRIAATKTQANVKKSDVSALEEHKEGAKVST